MNTPDATRTLFPLNGNILAVERPNVLAVTTVTGLECSGHKRTHSNTHIEFTGKHLLEDG